MFFFSFRFRRRVATILAIYNCLKSSDKRILHPSEISRATGFHMMTVVRILTQTPELFFRVPPKPNNGLTGYALTTATYARKENDVINFVKRRARLENFLYWTVLSAILVAFVYAILTMIPVLGDVEPSTLFGTEY